MSSVWYQQNMVTPVSYYELTPKEIWEDEAKSEGRCYCYKKKQEPVHKLPIDCSWEGLKKYIIVPSCNNFTSTTLQWAS